MCKDKSQTSIIAVIDELSRNPGKSDFVTGKNANLSFQDVGRA